MSKKETYIHSVWERNPGPFTEALLAYQDRLHPYPFAGYRGGAIIVNSRTERPNRDARRAVKRALYLLTTLDNLPAPIDDIAAVVGASGIGPDQLLEALADWPAFAELYE